MKRSECRMRTRPAGSNGYWLCPDRLWFKVKTGRWRGAATRLSRSDGPVDSTLPELAPWWLGAGGYRREGSPEDFYAGLTAIARRDGNSDRWLPGRWDWNRLKIEAAYRWERQIREVVCRLIAGSLHDGQAHQEDFHGYTVTALAKATDGETYLLVGTTNVADPRIFAVILNAVPGVDRDSWLPEPDRVEGLRLRPGEVVWSTILMPSVAARLLDAFADEG